jgi:hypothetical protein
LSQNFALVAVLQTSHANPHVLHAPSKAGVQLGMAKLFPKIVGSIKNLKKCSFWSLRGFTLFPTSYAFLLELAGTVLNMKMTGKMSFF